MFIVILKILEQMMELMFIRGLEALVLEATLGVSVQAQCMIHLTGGLPDREDYAWDDKQFIFFSFILVHYHVREHNLCSLLQTEHQLWSSTEMQEQHFSLLSGLTFLKSVTLSVEFRCCCSQSVLVWLPVDTSPTEFLHGFQVYLSVLQVAFR